MVLISLNGNPTCFGHFQPGIIYLHPWLWNSVDLLNWVPDRWFQCFQDSISNHFAHIAKLALKKGKELFCCINVPSELFAVKGMKKWRKSREWCLKNMRLELGNASDILMIPRSHHNRPLILMVNLQDTLKATVRTHSVTVVCKPLRCWEQCGKSGRDVGSDWLPVAYNLLINTTTEGWSMIPMKCCDCLQRRGRKHRHPFSRNHELIAFSMPNLHFLLQLQLTDFFS